MDLLDQVALDSSGYYRLDEFARPLIWENTLTVSCIFDDGHVEVETGEGPPVSSREPTALIYKPDLPALAVGDSVEIAGETFTVRDIQNDEARTDDLLLVLSV